MAKIRVGIGFSGTVGPVTFYMMGGKNYVRSKSSLDRKRVLKSKEFQKTRKYASDLGLAARIASVVYRALPANIKERWLYRAITGEAASLLYEGKAEQGVKDYLWKKYIEETNADKNAVISPSGYNMVRSTKETNVKLRQPFLERWQKQGKSYYDFKRAWQKRGYFSKETFREVLEYLDYS